MKLYYKVNGEYTFIEISFWSLVKIALAVWAVVVILALLIGVSLGGLLELGGVA